MLSRAGSHKADGRLRGGDAPVTSMSTSRPPLHRNPSNFIDDCRDE